MFYITDSGRDMYNVSFKIKGAGTYYVIAQ